MKNNSGHMTHFLEISVSSLVYQESLVGPVQIQTGYSRSVEKKKIGCWVPQAPMHIFCTAIDGFLALLFEQHFSAGEHLQTESSGFVLAERNTDHDSEATLHC